jgi:predicted porin
MPVGPVELAVAYIDATDFGDARKLGVVGGNAVVALGDFTAIKVGVKYTAGAIGVAAQYETIDDGSADDTTVMYLNGTYTAGANTFAAAYGITDDGTDAPTYMSIGMVHGFSKMTSAHVGYIALDNDAGDTNNGIAAGLRVKF